MTELVMIGFTDKHRAAEVLSQLQRLKFDWTADLHNGVAIEVESDGRLRMLQSHLLDPAAAEGDDFHWEALLSAIVPQPHVPSTRRAGVGGEARAVNAQGREWLKNLSFDQEFARNAAAVLRPGNSAILATIGNWQSAIQLLPGYSNVVLHTTLVRSRGGAI